MRYERRDDLESENQSPPPLLAIGGTLAFVPRGKHSTLCMSSEIADTDAGRTGGSACEVDSSQFMSAAHPCNLPIWDVDRGT